jgi:hypothetical protein
MPPVLHGALVLALAAAPHGPAEADRLVVQLGAASWHQREAASEKLLSLGGEAIPALAPLSNAPSSTPTPRCATGHAACSTAFAGSLPAAYPTASDP